MGNTHHMSGSFPRSRLDLNALELLNNYPNPHPYRLFRQVPTGLLYQEHHVSVDRFDTPPQYQIAIFQLRNQNPEYFPIVAHYQQIEEYGLASFDCAPRETNLRVLTEHLPVLLKNTNGLPFQSYLRVLKQVLAGFRILSKHVRIAGVTDELIGFNQQQKVKVWMSANLSNNSPDIPFQQGIRSHQSLECMLVQSIFRTVSAHAKECPAFYQFELQRTALKGLNLQAAEDFISDFCVKYRVAVPSKIRVGATLHPSTNIACGNMSFVPANQVVLRSHRQIITENFVPSGVPSRMNNCEAVASYQIHKPTAHQHTPTISSQRYDPVQAAVIQPDVLHRNISTSVQKSQPIFLKYTHKNFPFKNSQPIIARSSSLNGKQQVTHKQQASSSMQIKFMNHLIPDNNHTIKRTSILRRQAVPAYSQTHTANTLRRDDPNLNGSEKSVPVTINVMTPQPTRPTQKHSQTKLSHQNKITATKPVASQSGSRKSSRVGTAVVAPRNDYQNHNLAQINDKSVSVQNKGPAAEPVFLSNLAVQRGKYLNTLQLSKTLLDASTKNPEIGTPSTMPLLSKTNYYAQFRNQTGFAFQPSEFLDPTTANKVTLQGSTNFSQIPQNVYASVVSLVDMEASTGSRNFQMNQVKSPKNSNISLVNKNTTENRPLRTLLDTSNIKESIIEYRDGDSPEPILQESIVIERQIDSRFNDYITQFQERALKTGFAYPLYSSYETLPVNPAFSFDTHIVKLQSPQEKVIGTQRAHDGDYSLANPPIPSDLKKQGRELNKLESYRKQHGYVLSQHSEDESIGNSSLAISQVQAEEEEGQPFLQQSHS